MASTSVRWSSRTGFALAALGSAVGLGNIWRFPYVMGEHGGGAFLVAYLVAVLVLGWPLLMAEIAIGRHTHADGVAAYARLAPARPWRWAGWLGVAACVMILAYYPVIAGWVGQYLLLALQGAMAVPEGVTQASRFQGLVQDGVLSVGSSLAVLLLSVLIVGAGVSAGIERSSKILMPLFAALLLGLAAYSLSLPGATHALEFVFRPEWEALARPVTWLAAFGQALFSIGLAMGILVVYGSYLDDAAPVPRLTLALVVGDTLVALLASLIIFPAVFAMGMAPAQGPGLAFVTLPEVFARMPGGALAGVVFFLLLLIAALTSVVSLLEVPVSLLVSQRAWSRRKAVGVTGIVTMLAVMPVALGEAVSSLQFAGGMTLLSLADMLSSQVVLPLSAIGIALVVGWCWRRESAGLAAGLNDVRGRQLWWLVLRWVVPLALAIVLVTGLLPR